MSWQFLKINCDQMKKIEQSTKQPFTKRPSTKPAFKAKFKLSPLSQSLDFITKPIFAKRGFSQNKILTEWHLIVGNELAKFSSPKKLTYPKNEKYGAVLHVEIYNSGKAMEFSYNTPIIIEKIAIYFGYKAVSQIKIVQKPASNNLKPKSAKKQTEKFFNHADLQELTNDIEDEELRQSLRDLGSNV